MTTDVRRLEVRGIEDLLLATGGDREFLPAQMGRSRVSGELAAAEVGDFTLTYGRFQSDIHVAGTWSNKKATIAVLLAADGISVFGKPGHVGDIAVAGAGREIDGRYREAVEYVAINFDKSHALETAEGCGWAIDERILDGADLLSPDAPLAASLTSRVRRLASTMRSGGLASRDPATERRLADSVLIEFLRGVAKARPGPTDGRVSRRAPPRLVRRVVEWLTEDPAQAHRIPEIARRFEISPRHLNRAFQAEVGMSPAKYLKRYRMTRARLDLYAADPAERTVSAVAVSWGFWDLGRFAVEYRALFGERPSETLRTFASA